MEYIPKMDPRYLQILKHLAERPSVPLSLGEFPSAERLVRLRLIDKTINGFAITEGGIEALVMSTPREEASNVIAGLRKPHRQN
jgi:hypothetical protein